MPEVFEWLVEIEKARSKKLQLKCLSGEWEHFVNVPVKLHEIEMVEP